MFWGTIVKEGKPYKTKEALEEADYPVLHLSNVALPRSAPNGKVQLLASNGKDLKDLVLATLQKDKVETIALDIYINVTQQLTLSTSGGELHLSGFFEPQRAEMDEDMFLDGEEDEEEEEDVEEDGPGKLNQNLKQAKQNAMRNAALLDSDEEEEDDYDEEEEDEEDEDEESEEE